MKIVIIDNFDSFTFNLYQLICIVSDQISQSKKVDVQVIRNNDHRLLNLDFAKVSAIVIGPGPGTPKDTGYSRQIVSSVLGKTSILGVCLGHQLLVEMTGGDIIKASRPIHGHTELIKIESSDSMLFASLPLTFDAARYHSLVVSEESLSRKFVISARASSDNAIMAVEDTISKLFGIQFHPESFLTQHGDMMVKNFLGFSLSNTL